MARVRVADDCVFHIWRSKNNSEETAEVSPNWYEENGTPIDTDGDDMEYCYTEVDIE